MIIEVGDRVPDAVFKHMGSDGPLDVRDISTEELCSSNKVVLFGLPGAYTPVCSAEHLPGFVDKAGKFKEMGVDSVACVSGNDPFVMQAWAQALGADDNILMLSDHRTEFTEAMGLTLDLSDFGLGNRSERYSMVIDDGVITALHVEESILACDVSSGEALLAAL